MLRLTRITEPTQGIVLKAEGQIVAEWVGLLEDECLELLRSEPRVLLDLADVSYLDQRAIRVLRDLGTRAVAIINCPPLVEELLREGPS